jgi:hypothetical protein
MRCNGACATVCLGTHGHCGCADSLVVAASASQGLRPCDDWGLQDKAPQRLFHGLLCGVGVRTTTSMPANVVRCVTGHDDTWLGYWTLCHVSYPAVDASPRALHGVVRDRPLTKPRSE